MKLISIVTPTYNEADNVEELYLRIKATIANISKYEFEILFIDNNSTDNTGQILRSLAAKDKSVKIIFNNRNFGHIRSPYWGILQSHGNAIIYLASDLQDPPELIPKFIDAWEHGYKIALAVKPISNESKITHSLRSLYYVFLDKISDVQIVKNSTGFGLYDQDVVQKLREISDPYPFLRGLIAELGYSTKIIEFHQPRRLKGITKNNFHTLYDIAMLGIVTQSIFPIRVISLFGICVGIVSLLVSFFILSLKLIYWDEIPLGVAPFYVLTFFMFGIIVFFMGILGEYIATIQTFVSKRPIVVESERVNFED